MKQLFKMLVCYFKGHEYKRHFSENPINPQWFQCDRCNKTEWKHKTI